MAVRSTTTRRMATVVVATAAVSALGATGASAATSSSPAPAPTQSPQVVVPPLSLPQVGVLLNNLLGTVDGLIGTQLVAPTPLTESNKNKPLLQKTVANLTGTTKELPLLGGVVGGVTDGVGLSQPAKVDSKPSGPATAVPATPTKPRGRHHRVESVATPGSTWTSPMTAAPVVTPVVSTEEHHSPSHIPGFVRNVTRILPSSAAEAAAAGAGAATIALIVLGGIAVTGAAGAASAAGRRGLINGSVGGSL